jgi:hypothetical protein
MLFLISTIREASLIGPKGRIKDASRYAFLLKVRKLSLFLRKEKFPEFSFFFKPT